MRTTKRILFAIALLLILMTAFTACNKTATNYTGFYLQFITKEMYSVGESVSIQIKENGGSPEGYNIYQKIDDQEYSLKNTQSAKNPIVVQFNQSGHYYIKVVALLDGVEQSKKEEVDFSAVEASELELQNFYIKNNIVDLYYNVDNKSDSFDINGNLDIVYIPDYTIQKNLSYNIPPNPNISVQSGILKSTGYEPLQQPYVLPFFCSAPGKEHIKANMYFRINNSVTLTALTNIFAGYVDQNYYNGDWVSFQFMEYAGMSQADGYIVARKVGESYVDLNEATNPEVQKVVEHDLTFHKVKVTEPAGGYMNLRIYAKIHGLKSNVYTDVSIRVSEPTITATEIVLSEESRTMLLDQTYQIMHTVKPQNTFDKTVSYEILDDGDDYISIDESGVITPLKATEDVIKVKIISNSDTDVYAEIEIEVLNHDEAYFNFTYSAPLTQTIGDTQDVEFNVGTPGVSVKWFLDDVENPVSQTSQFTYEMIPPLIAGEKQITAQITLADERVIFINRILSLQSAFEFVDLQESYDLDASVDFEYNTLLNNTSVRWDVRTEDGSQYFADVGDFFSFPEADNYQVIARFSREGQPLEDKHSHIISIIDGLSHELFNVHTNGYFDGENYAPLIKWYNIPIGTEITIEITKDNQTTIYESTNSAYSDLFTNEGFKVPYEDFSLDDIFKYRIKTDISDRYTNFVYYNAEIHSSQYAFLNDLNSISSAYPPNFMNRYINNVHDLGKLLNYIQVFRPNGHFGDCEISIVLYFAINYNDVKDAYDILGEITSPQIQPNFINASKLITAANNAYGAGTGMSVGFNDTSNGDGGIELTFTLYEIKAINMDSSPDNSITEIIYDFDYPQTRGASFDNFPISQNSNTIEVTTSNELLLAASWGMRPLPISGSPAERIYNEAKDVLRKIIANHMTDMEKTLAIYDYLCLEIKYDEALYGNYMDLLENATTEAERNALNEEMRAYKSFHLEGVFDEKRAVCDGISKAFVLLTAIENIKAIKISGKAEGNTGAVNHAWNMVMLEGSWYYIDATWGRRSQPEGSINYIGVNHYYFKAIEEDMQASHTYIGENALAAKEKLYFYYSKDGLSYDGDWIIESHQELEYLISQLTQTLCIDIYIMYDYPNDYSSLEEYLNGHNGAFSSFNRSIAVKENIAVIMVFIS